MSRSDWMGENIVYIRMKKKINIQANSTILLKDIAYVTNHTEKESMAMEPLYRLSKKDKAYVVIDGFTVVDHIAKKFPDVECQFIGITETIIQIEQQKKRPSFLLIAFVWTILFIGTAMTIMNFHYDVSMEEVQQRVHFIFTGKHETFPLWIQIPYSIGLGVGMILFLNQWFDRRLNEEPSPLEVEIYNYQKNIDNYITHEENDLNEKYPPY